MAQGGEFAFVLFTTAAAAGLLTSDQQAIFSATVIISMVLTPLTILALKLLPAPAQSMDGVEEPDGLTGNVLVIGFGRFGQIASQPLLAKGHSISIIDNDTDMIRAAGQFGFKVYYGDGTRLDILRAAGAEKVDVVIIAIDKKDEAIKIAELIHSEFPLVKVMARAFDRGHALALVKAGVDFQIREMFESALVFGRETLGRWARPRTKSPISIAGCASATSSASKRRFLGGPAGRPRPAAFQCRRAGARERRGDGSVGAGHAEDGNRAEPVGLRQPDGGRITGAPSNPGKCVQ